MVRHTPAEILKPAAVIFDMDGVIVDSEPLNDQHDAAFFAGLGIDTSNHPERSFRGMNARTLWTAMKAEHGLEQEVEDLIRLARASYMKFLRDQPELPLVPGVDALIDHLSESGYKLGVVSSANPKRIDLFLERLSLADYFQVVISGDDVVNGKPAPDAFLQASDQLGVESRHSLVIEDSTAGVRAARAAGMICVGYAGSAHNKEDLSEAHDIITNFYELARSVKRHKGFRINKVKA